MDGIKTQDQWIGRVISGQFRILKCLGEGGMGAVYLAEQIDMQRHVVIKVIIANLTHRDDIVNRFRREATTLARLKHPNIVQVYLSGETEEGALFLVMEFIEGRMLSDDLASGVRMSESRVRRITEQIAAGLAAAHEAGVVHRDLKPANVMLVDHAGSRDHVMLLDFGIAKVLQPGGEQAQLTQTGHMMGTPAYMSPEQIEGRVVDGRSDIYSLGVMVYEMLTGTNPFIGGTPIECFFKHLKEPVTPPRVIAPDLVCSEELEGIIEQCLAKHPDARFKSAADLLEALEPGGWSRPITLPQHGPGAAFPSQIPANTPPPNPMTPMPTARPIAYGPRSSTSPILVAVALTALFALAMVIVVVFLTRDDDSTEPTAESEQTAEADPEDDKAPRGEEEDDDKSPQQGNTPNNEPIRLDSLSTANGGELVITDGATVIISGGQNTPVQPVNPVPPGTQNVEAEYDPDKAPENPLPSGAEVEVAIINRPTPPELLNPTLSHVGAFGVPLISVATVEDDMGSIVTYRTPHAFDVVADLYSDYFGGSQTMVTRNDMGGIQMLTIINTDHPLAFSIITIEASGGGTEMTFMGD